MCKCVYGRASVSLRACLCVCVHVCASQTRLLSGAWRDVQSFLISGGISLLSVSLIYLSNYLFLYF